MYELIHPGMYLSILLVDISFGDVVSDVLETFCYVPICWGCYQKITYVITREYGLVSSNGKTMILILLFLDRGRFWENLLSVVGFEFVEHRLKTSIRFFILIRMQTSELLFYVRTMTYSQFGYFRHWHFLEKWLKTVWFWDWLKLGDQQRIIWQCFSRVCAGRLAPCGKDWFK